MTSELHESSERGSTVAVWTPWGEQRVPRAENRAASLRRMVQRARESEAAKAERFAAV